MDTCCPTLFAAALPAVAKKKPSHEEAEPSLRTRMSNQIAERIVNLFRIAVRQ